jgi:hypothetical protein
VFDACVTRGGRRSQLAPDEPGAGHCTDDLGDRRRCVLGRGIDDDQLKRFEVNLLA